MILTDALTRAHGQVIEFSSHAADAGAQSLPSIRPLQAPLGHPGTIGPWAGAPGKICDAKRVGSFEHFFRGSVIPCYPCLWFLYRFCC